MTEENTIEEHSPSLENGVIQSLCYLYRELLRENLRELSYIMEITIQDCEESIRNNFSISQDAEYALKEFYILRKFRLLTKEQKEFFIHEMERGQSEQ